MTSEDAYEFGYRHGRQVSHFLVDVTAHGRENLLRVLSVAFTDTIGRDKRATHFHLDPNRQLTLLDGPPRTGFPAAAAFPKPATAEDATAFVWDWLETVGYPPDDEHDGATKKGWRAFNEQYGIVADCWEAFVAVRPMWIYLPK